MASFPTMSSGSMKVVGDLDSEAIAMHPSVINHSFATRIFRSVGDHEQRWAIRRELFGGILQYSQVNGYDMSLIREFFNSQKGRYVNSSLSNVFDITLFGITYDYCVFDQDELEVSVGRGETYSFELRIKQIRPN